MNMRKLILKSMAAGGVLTLALALFADRPGRRNSAPDRTSQSDTFEEIDAHIGRQMKRLNIPGAALAIVEDEEIAHLRGFGRARPGDEEPTPQTPFLLGSLTKSFTALAVMQLVEAGKIELDAPVQRYLPWFRIADPQASAQTTVRHLLNQTSGLPQLSGLRPLTDFDDSPSASERQARALSTLELTRPVGSKFEYSNMNYNLLGLVIEAASGESYEDYIQNHVFAPLQMSHSYTSQPEAKQNGLAVGHRYWFAIPFAEPNHPIPRGSHPTFLLTSSSEDMAHYLIAHLNEGRHGDTQIFSAAGIDELHHPAVEVNQMVYRANRPGKDRLAPRYPSQLLRLHGDPAGAKEGRGIARKCQPVDDGPCPVGVRGRRGQAASRRTVRPEPLWRYYSQGTAKPASHPGPPDRWRRRHAAKITPLATGS